jgi:hypothetical protein
MKRKGTERNGSKYEKKWSKTLHFFHSFPFLSVSLFGSTVRKYDVDREMRERSSRSVGVRTTISIGQICKFHSSFFGENVQSSVWVTQLISWKVCHRSYVVHTAKWRSWSVCFSSRLLRPLKLNAVWALFVDYKAAWLRSTMTQQRLNSLAVNHIHAPGIRGLSWCQCTDRGICFEEWNTCVNVWEMTAHVGLSPVVVSTLIAASPFDYLTCLTVTMSYCYK